MKRFIVPILLSLALISCARSPSPYHRAAVKSDIVHVYRQHNGDDFVYWYVLISSFNNTSTTYYYSSPTPLASFSSVNFTKGNLPAEVEAEIGSSKVETLAEQILPENDLPMDVEHDLAAEEAAYAEYSAQQGEIDSHTGATEAPATSEAPAESGGGTSGDSGGGDAGGGGGSD